MYAIRSYYAHLDDKIITAWNGLMISAMNPTGVGIQTPLSDKGSKTQLVWRYIDMGFSLLDDQFHNLVITSYSIHYTKLYETLSRAAGRARSLLLACDRARCTSRVAPLETRSTMRSERPTSGASSMEP